MPALSLLTPVDYGCSTCGYCSPPGQRSAAKSSYSYGMITHSMSPQFYQDLIDRGWRRSGTYTYHPDMARTCCPQYTIRLDAAAFKPTRQQRSAVNRWNRYLATGLKPGEEDVPMEEGKDAGKKKDKGKGKAAPFDLMSELRMHQEGYGKKKGKHTLKLELTPAVATPETYALYKRYQMSVHNDPEHKATMTGFRRFLCDSPLGDDEIKYSPEADTSRLPKEYKSYHVLYRVDGQLVGISVIDILPKCVSSVYFIWDPDWAWASLGKLSALYEIALVRDMQAAGAPGMDWVYMGYWIATCQKMRYKGEYAPSYLLDPGTNVFHALSPKLDKYLSAKGRGYTPFIEIEAMSDANVKALVPGTSDANMDARSDTSADSDDSSASFPQPPPPGFLDPRALDAGTMDNLMVLSTGGRGRPPSVVPYMLYRENLTAFGRVAVEQMVAAVGPELMASRLKRDFRTRGLLFFD